MQRLGRALRSKRSSRGDTIVEVVIVTAILALVLAGSYTLTGHSLQNGIDANKRTEATAAAQRQIEYIKNVYFGNSNQLKKFIPPQAPDTFCIVTNGGNTTTPSADTSTCTNYSGSGYAVSVKYNDDNKIFSVTASWESTRGSNSPNEVSLYYKVPPMEAPKETPLVNIDSSTLGADGFAPHNVWLYASVNPNSNLLTRCYFEFSTHPDLSDSQTLTVPNTPSSWGHRAANGVLYRNQCQGYSDTANHLIAGEAQYWGGPGSPSMCSESDGTSSCGSIGIAEKTDAGGPWPSAPGGMDTNMHAYFRFCVVTSTGTSTCSIQCHIKMEPGGFVKCG